MSGPTATDAAAEVLLEIRNHVAVITLNRPAALNSLSLSMVTRLHTLLEGVSGAGEVRAVLLRGAGEKAFCAGGDIRALYHSFKSTSSLRGDFFREEYRLDYLLHCLPKPYAVLMDGITMGGGMGLAQGSTLRIVGERTRIAMPEVGIGLFPDVGGSYFLSRLPGSLGSYLALTGIQIRAVDALYAQLADLYLRPEIAASLMDDLTSIEWSANADADLHEFLHARAARDLPTPALSSLRSAIDLHFSKPTVAAILASLAAESRVEYADWARQTSTLMNSRSPTMLCVTLRQLERGKSLGLADCFRMELAMVEQCFDQGDFEEGVRALLIDKDNAPRFRPERLDQVTDESVDAFFRDRWRGAAHPLADLGLS